MLNRIAVILVVATVGVAAAQTGTSPKGPKKNDQVPPGYKKDDLRGFTLYFSDEVLKQDRDSKLERKPLEALEKELIIVESVLPADKVKNLKAVPIWVEWDQRIEMGNGRTGRALAVFFGGHQANLLESSPFKSNAVTILSLKSLTAEHQPKTDSGRCVILHELAHAFHYHVVGDHPLVTTTYKQAMERKLYDPGLYVATNDREYFAELTCAYLDRLDYYPRNREELKKHDPKGYEMIEKFWGRAPVRKATAAAKGPKLPSPDGDGKFPLETTTERLKLGQSLVGEIPPASEWKGRPLAILMFPATSGRALALLPKLQEWYTEFQDYGLIIVGAETSGASAQDVQKVVQQRRATFPMVSDVEEFGVAGSFALPHVLLYDHTGKCIFRGAPLDSEPYLRIAVGKSILAAVQKESFGKPAQPVVDLLEAGTPISKVLTKLLQQKRATKKEDEDELNAIEAVLLAGGKKVFDAAVEKAKTDPIGAFFDAERLPTEYRGTSLERPAFVFVNKLKGNPKVERELRARNALAAIKRIDSQLSARDLSFDPTLPEFKQNNSILLKQLLDTVEKVRKAFPEARATDEAIRIAQRWDVIR